MRKGKPPQKTTKIYHSSCLQPTPTDELELRLRDTASLGQSSFAWLIIRTLHPTPLLSRVGFLTSVGSGRDVFVGGVDRDLCIRGGHRGYHEQAADGHGDYARRGAELSRPAGSVGESQLRESGKRRDQMVLQRTQGTIAPFQ